jgi:uridine kinase
MRLPPTPRVDFLRELVGEIAHNYGHGRSIVVVDGTSGTKEFADDLTTVFREAGHDAFRASIGDFHRSRADRTRAGAETPESYYGNAYDYRTLRRVLIDPFKLAGSTGFQTAAFDDRRDVPVESRWETAQADAMLIVDGEFLLRPELRGIWNYSIELVDGEENPVYEADAGPRLWANSLVDLTDPDLPRRVFADSC